MISPEDISGVDVGLLNEALVARLRDVDGVSKMGGLVVPYHGGVFRFPAASGYNSSFALQWNRFRTNQIDEANGTELSSRRLP
jgi:hypothetical protein